MPLQNGVNNGAAAGHASMVPSEVNRVSCVVDCPYTELKAKEKSSASFLGLGILTMVLGAPGSTLSGRTMVSLSSSFSRRGRILATTRTDMMEEGREGMLLGVSSKRRRNQCS